MTIEEIVSKWDPLMASLLPQTRPLDRAAIWGQTLQESNCNFAAEQTPGRPTGGIGAWQHTGITDANPRRRNLERFAADRSKPWQDPETQVRFVCQELLSDHARVLTQVAKTSSVPAAAGTVMAYFEAPAHWQEELQQPGSTSARLDVRIKGTERALAVILAATPAQPAPTKGAPMTDPVTVPGSQPVDQLAQLISEAELRLRDVVKAFAISKGVPGFIVDIGFSMFMKLDLASLLQHGLQQLEQQTKK